VRIPIRYTPPMPQIAVRLPEGDLSAVDDLVESGVASSRADAVRRGLALLIAQAREEWIAEEYRRAYEKHPQGEEEAAWSALSLDALRQA